MLVNMMKGKIHRAIVTEANLKYMGSVTIDQDLLDAAGILVGEHVLIVNNNNGARLETYTISGERGSGMMCLNGAAARLVQPGDEIIVIAFGLMEEGEARTFKPRVVFVDQDNQIMNQLDGETARTIG
ncbi:MAG: aspartate 1-decarboxylase [Cellulosilyticaceae bacterium]